MSVRPLALAPAYMALCVLLGWWIGQDVNWDLFNYHFYTPHLLIEGRFERDLYAAGVESFHNPVPDLPLYAAVRLGLPPIAFFLTLSALVCRAKTAVSSGCESHPAKGRCSRKQSERGEEVTTFAETLR